MINQMKLCEQYLKKLNAAELYSVKLIADIANLFLAVSNVHVAISAYAFAAMFSSKQVL
jgi:hypothetical protein